LKFNQNLGDQMTILKINGKQHTLNIEPETPLLWAIRDNVNLTGTKYGCGIQQCGACTVHVNGRPVRSCGITVGEVEGKDITTIEGLSEDSLNPVQMAWVEEQVPQCGYCQSGQIMAAVSLLERKPNPTDQDIDRGMLNLCRCGTYPRIRKAIHRASDLIKEVA
jgi:isoquinoline 1-oxidoreductase alpha subunit